MDDAMGGIVGLFFLFMVFVIIMTLVVGWELLKFSMEAWEASQRRQIEAQKLDDIQAASAIAQTEIDQIMNYYRQAFDYVLFGEAAESQVAPDVVIISNKDY